MIRLSLLAVVSFGFVFDCTAREPGAKSAKSKVSAADKYEKEIVAFEAADKVSPPPANGILFIGSSSMRMWKTVAEDFPGLPVYNRGFGGSQIEDVNRYLDRIVLPYRPKTIVFYCGGNDLNAKKTPERVLADWQKFANTVRKALPEVRILYIAMRPSVKRAALREIENKTNAMIRADVESRSNMKFIDTTPALVDEKGNARADLLIADGLHMNATGYAIWTKILTPLLKE